jgi:hypothetical protein
VEAILEDSLLRPVFGGRGDIQRFSAEPASEVLLLPYGRAAEADRYDLLSGEALRQDSPLAWAWLEAHEAQLRERSGAWTDANWWGYSRRQNLERFDQGKILIPYMIDHLCAHHDGGRHFFVNVSTGGYGISDSEVDDVPYLTAILNSRLLSWVLRRRSRAFRGGWFAARAGNLAGLPVAEPDQATKDQIASLYEQCVLTKAAIASARGDAAEALARRTHAAAVTPFDLAIDTIYGLTNEEREVVATF